MRDRHEQAGAHAEARTQTWTDPYSDYADGYVSGHMAGVEWADANHTITREELVETAAKVSERFGGIQSPGALRILFAVALADLGIEVEDDGE